MGALAGAALFGPGAALPLAVTMAAVQWSAHAQRRCTSRSSTSARSRLASLSAAAVFSIGWQDNGVGHLVTARGRASSRARVYFFVNTGLLSGAMALEGHDRWRRVWNERFSWLLPHYVAFGAVG